jgi:hypothetical protein
MSYDAGDLRLAKRALKPPIAWESAATPSPR